MSEVAAAFQQSPVQPAVAYVLVKTFQVSIHIFKKISVVLEFGVLSNRCIAKLTIFFLSHVPCSEASIQIILCQLVHRLHL